MNANLGILMVTAGYGLNKAARLLREQLTRGAREQERLEPDFPYDVLGFDSVFFNAYPSDIPPDKS